MLHSLIPGFQKAAWSHIELASADTTILTACHGYARVRAYHEINELEEARWVRRGSYVITGSFGSGKTTAIQWLLRDAANPPRE
jgi:predicted NACHT family NTPase